MRDEGGWVKAETHCPHGYRWNGFDCDHPQDAVDKPADSQGLTEQQVSILVNVAHQLRGLAIQVGRADDQVEAAGAMIGLALAVEDVVASCP